MAVAPWVHHACVRFIFGERNAFLFFCSPQAHTRHGLRVRRTTVVCCAYCVRTRVLQSKQCMHTVQFALHTNDNPTKKPQTHKPQNKKNTEAHPKPELWRPQANDICLI
jgi:hypothetical protein